MCLLAELFQQVSKHLLIFATKSNNIHASHSGVYKRYYPSNSSFILILFVAVKTVASYKKFVIPPTERNKHKNATKLRCLQGADLHITLSISLLCCFIILFSYNLFSKAAVTQHQHHSHTNNYKDHPLTPGLSVPPLPI